MDNKTLRLKFYADMNDAPVTDLLRQANIKTENQLMDFYDSSCQLGLWLGYNWITSWI